MARLLVGLAWTILDSNILDKLTLLFALGATTLTSSAVAVIPGVGHVVLQCCSQRLLRYSRPRKKCKSSEITYTSASVSEKQTPESKRSRLAHPSEYDAHDDPSDLTL